MSDAGDPGLDPVVREAMIELTSWVFRRRRIYNLRLERREKSLSEPSARAAAIHTFKHLKHHRYPFDPGEIRSWACTHGWPEKDADQLGEYAAGVLSGTRYHTHPDPFGRLAIKEWRARAEESGLTGRMLGHRHVEDGL